MKLKSFYRPPEHAKQYAVWSLQMGRSPLQQATGVFLSAFDGHLAHLFLLGAETGAAGVTCCTLGPVVSKTRSIDVVSCLGKLFNSLSLSICGSKKRHCNIQLEKSSIVMV